MGTVAGNATVTLTVSGKPVVYDLWIQLYSSSSPNEFLQQQLKGGISWNPVRRAEQIVNFTAIWPLIGSSSKPTLIQGYQGIDPHDGFAKMNAFQDAIHSHQLSLASSSAAKPSPMVFNYINNSNASTFNPIISREPLSAINHSGFITVVEKNYERFKNLYTTTYKMVILNKNVSSNITPTSTMANNLTPYAPTAYDVIRYKDGWQNIPDLVKRTNDIPGLPANG